MPQITTKKGKGISYFHLSYSAPKGSHFSIHDESGPKYHSTAEEARVRIGQLRWYLPEYFVVQVQELGNGHCFQPFFRLGSLMRL